MTQVPQSVQIQGEKGAAEASVTLTVIIPTWNRKDLLRNCLKSLSRQTSPFQVLVVNNGVADLSGETMDGQDLPPQLHFLNLGSNLGFAAAVNEGIRYSSTPFVALLNDDTEADERWVEVGLAALTQFRDYSFFASKIVNYDRRTLIDAAGDCYGRQGLPAKRGFGQAVNKFSKNEPVLGASAAAAFYRRSLFDDIGFFDEDFWMYLEDVDLSLRAQLRGHRCLYLSDAVVYHLEAASDPDRKSGNNPDSTAGDHFLEARPYYSRQRAYWLARNRWLLMVTYQPVSHSPWLAYAWIRSTLAHLLRHGFLGSFLRGLLAGILHTRQALRKRFRVSRQRTISKRSFYELLREC